MKLLKTLVAIVAMSSTLAFAQPAEWGVPISGTNDASQAIEMEFHMTNDSFDLYFGSELLVSVPKGTMTNAQWAVEIRIRFNEAIRARHGVMRNPLNHPVDGPLFRDMLALLCWDEETTQFIDPAYKDLP